MQHELATLRVVRLKGMATPTMVAAAAGISEADAEVALEAGVAAGACSEANGRFRLTPAGVELADRLLGAERAGLDQTEISSLYEAFHPLNAEMKDLASAWQIRDGQPNDHADPAYDQSILDRLVALDERLSSFLGRVVSAAPRLHAYPTRFRAALDQIQRGDHSWFLRPIVDSYHTVWFELHEELIALCGLSRRDEALAGRAE